MHLRFCYNASSGALFGSQSKPEAQPNLRGRYCQNTHKDLTIHVFSIQFPHYFGYASLVSLFGISLFPKALSI